MGYHLEHRGPAGGLRRNQHPLVCRDGLLAFHQDNHIVQIPILYANDDTDV